MDVVLTNLIWLVVFPAAIVTGSFYTIQRLLRRLLQNRSIDSNRIGVAVFVISVYFLGHPLYPSLVPLIRASTPWLFSVGGVYFTLGLFSFVHQRYPYCSAIGCWLASLVGVVVALLAANRLQFSAVLRLLGSNSIEISLYLSLSLAAMFPVGYVSRQSSRKPIILSHLLVFSVYVLALVNSIPLTERVRGPAALVFIVFGVIGVLLGIPLYVLGDTLTPSSLG